MSSVKSHYLNRIVSLLHIQYNYLGFLIKQYTSKMVHMDKGGFNPIEIVKNFFIFIMLFFQSMFSPLLNLTNGSSQSSQSSFFRSGGASSGGGGGGSGSGSGNTRRRNNIHGLPSVSDISSAPCASGGCCGG
uniref:Uncharacterized protein n=1 Tax=Strongyloides venezuelensis TaxID=75913 RepID=A0A0K0FR52_STRVS